MAREAGAKKVYFASCAPPIRYPNVYGIDMPTRKELVAYNRNEDEVAEDIGADKVIYEDLTDLIESVRKFNPVIETFDTSVFDGNYVTGDVDEAYFNYIEGERDNDDKASSTDNESIGLHNSFRK
jgi:amidophosphoribosyltransferase